MIVSISRLIKVAIWWLSLVVVMAARVGFAAATAATAPGLSGPLPALSITTPREGDITGVSLEVGRAALRVSGLCDARYGKEIDFTLTSPAFPKFAPIVVKGVCDNGHIAESIDLTPYPYGTVSVAVSMKDQHAKASSPIIINVVKTPGVSTRLTAKGLLVAVRWPAAPSIQQGSYKLELQPWADCSKKPIQSFNFSSSSGKVTFPGTGLYFLCLSFSPSSGGATVKASPVPRHGRGVGPRVQ